MTLNVKRLPKEVEINSNSLVSVVAADKVTRWLCGTIPMTLTVEKVTSEQIICGGGWEFDRVTGAKMDDELVWGNERTGSFITVNRETVE
jgi:hypothetical protein